MARVRETLVGFIRVKKEEGSVVCKFYFCWRCSVVDGKNVVKILRLGRKMDHDSIMVSQPSLGVSGLAVRK